MTSSAIICTHPAAHRDVYTANGRVFSWCRACDSDVENGRTEQGS